MKASPEFIQATKAEVGRLMDRRAREARDRGAAAAKDIQSSRKGLIKAERELGYAQTELEQWARESGNSTVRGMASKMKGVLKQLRAINSDLETLHAQANRTK